jgi:hypothetical protein
VSGENTLVLFYRLAALGSLTVVGFGRAGRFEAVLHRYSPVGIYDARGHTLREALEAVAALEAADMPAAVP